MPGQATGAFVRQHGERPQSAGTPLARYTQTSAKRQARRPRHRRIEGLGNELLVEVEVEDEVDEEVVGGG